MKYIKKGNEPQNFITWKSNASNTYSNLRNPIKADLKNALLLEQGYICCYCESKISSNNSHIEHLDPQCNNNSNDLEFTNLLCSCQNKLFKGEPRHCGNSKDNKNIPITPLMEGCEEKFTYTADGQIQHTDLTSQKTIKYLKLDIDKLNKLRESAIDSILYLDPIEKNELLSEKDIKVFAQDYLKIKDSQYNEFHTTIKYLFG